ncbi:hypothetical protein CF165_46395 [Amycolatopsis vastitatis]|uniref:Amino acid permease/ SLC12A domain-containing protein n=1 Tax=Amycolatopsis vastitatis TaxID=1905142 RepID=A0A229SKZ9_9PSEU|nr:hypothetical protein CF165_46395 [Amycolatopsis vastitatis]
MTVAVAKTGSNFPLLFVVIALVYRLFCVGYLAASRLVPADTASGAFYHLARRGLGRPMGVGAGWVAVAAYTALTVGLYGFIGAILGPPLSSLLGVTVPWQAVALPAVLLVGWLGLLKIEVGTKFLLVLVTCEVLMIIVVTVANLLHPAAGTSPLDALDLHQLTRGTSVVGAQLALAVLGYIGTELTVVHTRDARDGHRGVSRATVATIAVLTVLYVAAPAGLSVTLGVDGVVTAAQADPGALFVNTARSHLGDLAATIVQVLFAGSLVAGAISFHGATSLYSVYLGRDHAAPKFLGRVGRRHGSAIVASLSQTVLAIAAIILVSILGADPVTVLFYVGGTAGAVGILALLALTALATAVILLRHRPGASEITDVGAPAARLDDRNGAAGHLSPVHRRWAVTAAIPATIVLVAISAVVMVHLDTLLGVGPDSPLPLAVQLTYSVVFAVGVGWSLWHRRRPDCSSAPAGRDR